METPAKGAIVEVLYGPMASRKAILKPGGSLRVGRTDKADLPVPHDEHMSGVHFELSLSGDGKACELFDRGSAGGTFLSGERVESAKLSHGDWIRAGSTNFSFHFEARTAPRPNEVSTLPLAVREEALRTLTGVMARGPLYALLDAARTDRVLVMLKEAIEEHWSLYDGISAVTQASVAPYLIELRDGSGLLSRLVLEGWGDARGIYFTSRRPRKEVRSHLRKLLMVMREEPGDMVFFRFYDPRVISIVLPSMNPRQEAELFGDIEHIYCEDDAGRVLRLSPGHSRTAVSA
jgi:hypothetical protein